MNAITLTTEEPPIKLIPRMVSNHTSSDYGLFIDRQDINNAMAAGQQVAEVSVVPQVLWQNPGIYPQLQQLHTILNNYVYFVDWSHGQGYSIETHFDMELDKLERLGWRPQVILFDWVGGGLAQLKDQDKLRHSYQTAVDHIVNYCNRTNRAAVVFAPLNKSKVSPAAKSIRMNMLSENLTMTNNIDNFLGISALRPLDETGEGKPLLQTRQFFTADKARYGGGGLVPVEQHFKFQRFTAAANARLVGEERKA